MAKTDAELEAELLGDEPIVDELDEDEAAPVLVAATPKAIDEVLDKPKALSPTGLTRKERRALERAADAPAEVEAKADDSVRLHPILTNAQVREAQAAARARMEADRIKAAMKAVEAAEVQRLRIEEGFSTGNSNLDDLVDLTVNTAEFTDRIVIDGVVYMHGHTYQVTRAKAQSMAEIMQNTFRHEDIKDGKTLEQQFARQRLTMISERTGVVTSAPNRNAA